MDQLLVNNKVANDNQKKNDDDSNDKIGVKIQF